MRIIADIIAVTSFVVACVLAVLVFGGTSATDTVFDGLMSAIMLVVAAVLFACSALWGIVAQNCRAQGTLRKEERKKADEAIRVLREIADRGYDIVDRLEKKD